MVVSVDINEFNQKTDPRMRKFWGDAYTFCCQMCLNTMCANTRTGQLPGQIEYIFEKGGPKWKKADKKMWDISLHPTHKLQYRYRGHQFVSKAEAAPLQCAHMLANLRWRTINKEEGLEGTLDPLLALLCKSPGKNPITQHCFTGELLDQVLLQTLDYNLPIPQSS